MEINKLSASSYKKYSFCPMAYFIEQNLNYRFPMGKAANLGTITHAVLEILAQIKLGQQKNLSEVETEIGLISVSNFDIEHITDNIYYKYTIEEYPHLTWEPKDFKDVKKYVNNCLNHNNGAYNPLNKNIISTEQYLRIPVEEDWAILPENKRLNITGFIDLITEVNNSTIEITDYKTGSMSDFTTGKDISFESLHDDIQLRLYHLAASQMYGCEKNYILTMFFLKFSTPITISFSCEDLPETMERVKRRFIEIYNTKIPRLNKSWDRPMSKCRKFCDFGKKEWPGNKIVPETIQFLDGQVSSVGAPMCYCDAISLEVNRRGMGWVLENMKNENS